MSLLQVGGAEWRLMELSGGGWIWMQLSEGGLSWKQVGALFSNTRFGFQHVLTIQTQAKNTANLANAAVQKYWTQIMLSHFTKVGNSVYQI